MTGNATLTQLISTAASNPAVAAALAIQFLLGLALGYVAVKAVKYILAFIGILALGAFLNVWALGEGSVEGALEKYYAEIKQYAPQILDFAKALGLMTVTPVSLGFLVGALIAATR